MKHYAEAENLLKIALKQSEHVSPQDRVMTLRSLGLVYAGQKQYDRAAEQLSRACETLVQIDGPKSLALAETYEDLGAVQTKGGAPAKALATFQKALDVHELRGTLDSEIPGVLVSAARAARGSHNLPLAQKFFARVMNVVKNQSPEGRQRFTTAMKEYRDLLKQDVKSNKDDLKVVDEILKARNAAAARGTQCES
ncbi:MAG: tetratricopeptide repeat protein [Candidatus Obscuribacterales bacterium]|nr:tetratricopeptide repeat protein [Candidatus Obscuribacterales bacterium]